MIVFGAAAFSPSRGPMVASPSWSMQRPPAENVTGPPAAGVTVSVPSGPKTRPTGPAKPKEPKSAPRNDRPQDEKPATPRKPDDLNRQSPSDNEILSGKSLNGLLEGLRRFSADGDSEGRPNALLPPDVDGLKHVNV